MSAVKELTPVFVSDGGEKAEAVTIDIHVKDMTLSAISAYGPQESATCEKKLAFRTYLSQEAQRANSLGKWLVLQGDLNAWLWPSIIKCDSCEQNWNGKLFSMFLKKTD